MDEYISRDSVIKSNSTCEQDCASCDFAIDGDSWCQGEIFVVDVLRIPAADVAPVVRCKDCKFWNRERISVEGLARCQTGETGIRYRKATDFCSVGVKVDLEET